MKNQDEFAVQDIAAIQKHIISIRNVHAILDRDLAVMYGVEVKHLNRQVKRNIERFPADFMFQLTNKLPRSPCHFLHYPSPGGDYEVAGNYSKNLNSSNRGRRTGRSFTCVHIAVTAIMKFGIIASTRENCIADSLKFHCFNVVGSVSK